MAIFTCACIIAFPIPPMSLPAYRAFKYVRAFLTALAKT